MQAPVNLTTRLTRVLIETSGKKPKGKVDKSQIGLPSGFRYYATFFFYFPI